jgi:hypothetical protein
MSQRLNNHLLLRFAVISSVLIGVFLCFYVIWSVVNWPETSREIEIMDVELNRLAIPSNSSRVSATNGVSRKARQATVYATFLSSLSEAQLDDFYRTELLKDGWSFHAQRNYADANTSEYCKGNYGFTIRHNLQPVPKSWAYSLYLRWSASGCVT